LPIRGETLEFDGTTIRTLTPESPLGASLMRNHVGDEVVLGRPGRQMTGTITWIR
jgi:transcription elongation GreA/GreB family factor